MRAQIVKLPSFNVIGYKIQASVEEFEAGLGQQTRELLIQRKDEIVHRQNDNLILMQIYPTDSQFDAQVDRFTNLLCYEIIDASEQMDIPAGMMLHHVPANTYVICTHQGLEEHIGETYQYLYVDWMQTNDYEPLDYDFEVWDGRYHPDSEENEIDIYVALK